MKLLVHLKEKLYGAYDTVSSRTNCYHNGGTASEELYTDLEYTLGLDNRGEMGIREGIVLLVSGITIAVILLVGSQILRVIPIPDVRLLGAILIIVFIFVFILAIKSHK